MQLSCILLTYTNCVIFRPCWPTTSATSPCLMPVASWFNPSSSALSHPLPKMTPVTSVHPTPPAPLHIRTSLFIVQFVYELFSLPAAQSGSFLQSTFMNSPVYCGHAVTVCLICLDYTFSDQQLPSLTAQLWLHHQPTSRLH